MNNLLCIETSGDICSVCISQNGYSVAEQTTNTPKSHAAQLCRLISQSLALAQLTIRDLDGVVYSAGPGSYSGLRIGLSAAKGICYGRRIPLIAVNTLQALAHHVYFFDKKDTFSANNLETNNVVYVATIDARKEIYFATYDAELNPIDPPQPTQLTSHTFEHLSVQHKIFFGSALATKQHLLPTHNATYLPPERCYHSATHLAQIGYNLYCQRQFEDLVYAEPQYLKIATYNQIHNF